MPEVRDSCRRRVANCRAIKYPKSPFQAPSSTSEITTAKYTLLQQRLDEIEQQCNRKSLIAYDALDTVPNQDALMEERCKASPHFPSPSLYCHSDVPQLSTSSAMKSLVEDYDEVPVSSSHKGN